MKVKYWYVLLLALFIASCSDKTVTDPNTLKTDKIVNKIDKLGDSLTTKVPKDEYGRDQNIPGVIIALWSDELGFNYVRGYGTSNLITKEPMRPNNLFRIGSITKTFVITVFLQLVDEKKVSLDDNLSKFYPDYPKANEITLRQLCNMTSGIYNFWESDSFFTWIGQHPQLPVSKWLPVSWVKGQFYNFPPGHGFHYSNTNTYLIGLIIETLTGNKLEDEVDNRIIKKLGLNNTFFPTAISFPRYLPYSNGYFLGDSDLEQKDRTELLDMSLAWSAGAMISNIDDLRIWGRTLASGSLISAASQTERLKTVPYEEAKMNYGLGIMEYKGFFGHGGNIFGYQSMLLYSPSRKTTITVMLNATGNQIKAARDIVDCYLSE